MCERKSTEECLDFCDELHKAKGQLGSALRGLRQVIDDNEKSGFFDLPEDKTCRDKQHNPPGHMVIPKGKGYRHICPACGHVTLIVPSQITM